MATSAAFTELFEEMADTKFGLDEITPMPPISGIRATIWPPAAATIWSTLLGKPLGWLKATT